MSDKEIKLHYYCFTYIGLNETELQCNASTYTGYLEKEITIKKINENKKNAGVNDNAVLLAASYLGYMTTETMTGENHE